MKKLIALVLALVGVISLAGCNKENNEEIQLDNTFVETPEKEAISKDNSTDYSTEYIITDVATPNLNMLTLKDLVNRCGENLTWGDFNSYYCEEFVESGFVILRYPINNDYCLLIGGADTEQVPMYIRLVSQNDANDYIDVRTDDIDSFINSHITPFHFEKTTFYYGENSYDVTSRVPSINLIMSATPVGQKIVVECHVGPKNGVYCIFDTVTESFECDLKGNNLIWYNDDITTAVYSLWSGVYKYDGSVLKSYELKENEFIDELTFSDDFTKLIVKIDNGETEEVDIIDLLL